MLFYIALAVVAAMIAVLVLYLEHRGDPAVLEKDYSRFAFRSARHHKGLPEKASKADKQ